jgi:hypothetical protein
MLNQETSDLIVAWLPSKHQPNPSTLGDFLKLVSNRVPKDSNSKSSHVHLTTIVKVAEICCGPDPQWVLNILKSFMKHFEQQWTESHRGSELSKFRNFLTTDWTLDHIDAMRCGCFNPEPEWKLHVLNDGDETTMSYGPSLEFIEDTLVSELYTLNRNDAEGKEITDDKVLRFEQTRHILGPMWCVENPHTINARQRQD